ncbi:MAG TPA: DinB family protein, partial [Candidatus Xenobia bacterium]
WPKSSPSAAAWIESVEAFKSDHAAMCKLVSEGDLYTPFPWGDGQTLLREALLVADHNAYHVGQLLTVRRALGVWHE